MLFGDNDGIFIKEVTYYNLVSSGGLNGTRIKQSTRIRHPLKQTALEKSRYVGYIAFTWHM